MLSWVDNMPLLAHSAMQEGALGLASALIYAPAFYAEPASPQALAAVAAEYDGLYCSHMRSAGSALLRKLQHCTPFARTP
jgi:N-acyl-D-amino-acid deacylase